MNVTSNQSILNASCNRVKLKRHLTVWCVSIKRVKEENGVLASVPRKQIYGILGRKRNLF